VIGQENDKQTGREDGEACDCHKLAAVPLHPHLTPLSACQTIRRWPDN
jgi:hypothetical protein